MTQSQSIRGDRILLDSEDTQIVTVPRAPVSMGVYPGDGASVLVEVTVTPVRLLDDAIWHELDIATESTLIAYPSPITAVRLTASGGTATVDVVS